MELRLAGYDYGLKSVDKYQDIKFLLHNFLIAEIERDHVALLDMERQEIADYVNGKVLYYVADKGIVVSAYDLETLTEEMVDELAGYGPLENLMYYVLEFERIQ